MIHRKPNRSRWIQPVGLSLPQTKSKHTCHGGEHKRPFFVGAGLVFSFLLAAAAFSETITSLDGDTTFYVSVISDAPHTTKTKLANVNTETPTDAGTADSDTITNTGTSTSPTLFVYTYFERPNVEAYPTTAQRNNRVGYFVCPTAAMLQKFGHELRVLGLSATQNLTNPNVPTFSTTFIDGTVVKDRKFRGNHHVIKTFILSNALNETATRERDEQERRRGRTPNDGDPAPPPVRYTPSRDDTVLFVDAFDVIFLRDPAAIGKSLHHGGGDPSSSPKAFMSGERICFPFQCVPTGFCTGRKKVYTLAGGRQIPGEDLCEEQIRVNGGRFNHINSGFIWGTADGLRAVYDDVPNRQAEFDLMPHHDDQGMMQLVQLRRPDLLALDTEMRWCYIGSGGNVTAEYGLSPKDVVDLPADSPVRKEWPKSVVSGLSPVAMHFNGPSRPDWVDTKQLVKQTLLIDKYGDWKDSEGRKYKDTVKASWIDVDHGSTRVECDF